MSEQEFHVPVDDIVKNVPMLLRGEAKKLLNKLDGLDLNHDGKRDLAQIAAVLFTVLPLLAEVNGAIDFDELANYICELPFVKDKEAVAAAIRKACAVIEKADG